MISEYIKPPYSLFITAIISSILGLIFPIIQGFGMILHLPWFIYRMWPYFLMGIVIAVLYKYADKAEFRISTLSILGGIIFLFIAIFCVYISIWCYKEHICMAGHMKHPPYLSQHYLIDAGWALSLLLSGICLSFLRSHLAIGILFYSNYLISMRFIFGGIGGSYVYI